MKSINNNDENDTDILFNQTNPLKETTTTSKFQNEFESYKIHLKNEYESIKLFFIKILKFTRTYRCVKRKLKILNNFKKIYFSKIKSPFSYIILNLFIIFLIWLAVELFTYDDVRRAVKAQNLKFSITCDNTSKTPVHHVDSSYHYHKNYFNLQNEHYNSKSNLTNSCVCKLVGHCLTRNSPNNFKIYTDDYEFSDFRRFYMHPIMLGGYWRPPECKPDFLNALNNQRVDKLTFIIVPYLNRYENLKELLFNLHPFLQRQYINYRIIVVEQSNSEQSFNKGRLYNAAFTFLRNVYSNKTGNLVKISKNLDFDSIKNDLLSVHGDRLVEFDCMILHDVDLIPENDYNIYECDNYTPRHLSLSIRRNNNLGYYKNLYELLVGGVLTLKPDMYENINGFSNEYWKWGAEDDDLAIRMISRQMCIQRPSEVVSLYKMSSHKPSVRNPIRGNLLFSSVIRMKYDGLKNLYKLGVEIVDFKLYSLFTHIKVDVKEPDVDYIEKYS